MITPEIKDRLDATYRKYKKLPTASQLAEKLSITELDASHILGEYKKPDHKQLRLNFPAPKVEEVQEKTKAPVSIVSILRVACYILAIVCMSRQMVYIYAFFYTYDSNHFTVSLFAFAMVFGGIVTIELAIWIWGFSKLKAIPLLFIALVIALLGMVATTQGMYNSRTEKSGASIEYQQKTERVKKIGEAEKVILQDRDQDRVELAVLQGKLASYEAGSYEYNRTVNRIDRIKERIDSKNADLKKYEDELYQISQGIKTERKDFFTLLGDLFGTTGEAVEFWVSLIPALILDLLAPISAAFAVFLKEGEK